MQLNPYLMFDGQCDEAFKYYEQVLGGKITFKMTFAESPAAAEVPPEAQNRIIHATLAIGDRVLMASDCPPGRYEKPRGVYISIHVKDISEGERIFNALAEGGSVQMPYEQTFWAARFGMCVDRFGTPWMINCEEAS